MRLTVELGFSNSYAKIIRVGIYLRILTGIDNAKPAEIRRLLRGDLDAGRAQELMDEMRAAGLPT